MPEFKLSNVGTPPGWTRMPAGNNKMVVGGAAGVSSTDLGVTSGLKLRTKLIANGTLNIENKTPTAKNLSLDCLSALCISVERDTNPGFSFITDNSDHLPQNEKIKDDGSSMFPELNDPWHEHDESLSISDKIIVDQAEMANRIIRPQTLLDSIHAVNTTNGVTDTVRLKQLRGQIK